jgi:hypothetical protein
MQMHNAYTDADAHDDVHVTNNDRGLFTSPVVLREEGLRLSLWPSVISKGKI